MSDKDLLVVISEMLRRQDQHTEILNGHTRILEQQSNILSTVSSTLTQSLDTFTEHFEEQKEFNTKFLKALGRLDNIERLLENVVDMNERIKRLEAAVFK